MHIRANKDRNKDFLCIESEWVCDHTIEDHHLSSPAAGRYLGFSLIITKSIMSFRTFFWMFRNRINFLESNNNHPVRVRWVPSVPWDPWDSWTPWLFIVSWIFSTFIVTCARFYWYLSSEIRKSLEFRQFGQVSLTNNIIVSVMGLQRCSENFWSDV